MWLGFFIFFSGFVLSIEVWDGQLPKGFFPSCQLVRYLLSAKQLTFLLGDNHLYLYLGVGDKTLYKLYTQKTISCMKNQNLFLGLSPIPNQFGYFEKPEC